MSDHDVMELGADARGGCGPAPEAPGADAQWASEAPTRLCATCVNRCSHTPMRCGLLRTDEPEHAGDLCHVLRMRGGICGPEGLYWRAVEPGVTNVILFPGELRYSGLPRAGSFDGGSAA